MDGPTDPKLTEEEQAELDYLLDQEDLEREAKDPLYFVVNRFPWGIPETILAEETGPDAWQEEILCNIRDGLMDIATAIMVAVASGHGIGKSALVAWIILWAVVTMEDARGVVTANTEVQLRTKTWAELAKWRSLMRGADDFPITATAIASRSRPLTWRIDAIAWSEEKPESFAGLHNAGKRVVLIFDEASTIADIIWQTAQGALTDVATELIWLVFGNPTRNTGRFRECFGRFRHRWITRQIDSRTAKKTNKAEIAKLVEDYGEDHDIVRVRVRGIFPRSGSMQFIGSDLVEGCMARLDPQVTIYDPCVMGVDVARSLDGDETVLFIRRGRDARSIPRVRMRTNDTMLIAARIVEEVQLHAVDAVFVDGGGVGGGVIDRLRQLRQPVIEIAFGSQPTGSVSAGDDGTWYFNRRAEMWGAMREWLKGGYLPKDAELEAELTGLMYGHRLRDARDAILLESKKDMKKRGLSSPDSADALCLTFAHPVQKSNHSHRMLGGRRQQVDYDPYASFGETTERDY
jgi:hypothetical protein